MANKNKSKNTVSDTITGIEAKKVSGKAIVYWVKNRKGFGVRVSPKGKKTYVYRYKYEGKTRLISLGVHNEEFTLAHAHAKLSKAVAQVENGIDVWATQRDDARKSRESPTVKEFAATFINDYCIGKKLDTPNLKSWPEYKRILNRDVVPALKHLKMQNVTRQDVVAMINKVGERAPIQANRVLGVVRKMFSFAVNGKISKGDGIGFNILDANVCMGIPTYRKEKPRERVLEDHEIKELWFALPDSASGRALKMLLICGQRSSEVRLMSWGELSGNVWTIPAERTKTGVEQVISLPSLAMEIIELQRKITGGAVYVFEGRRHGHSAYGNCGMATNTLLKRLKETICTLGWDEYATPHDFRRTFRTRLSELKVDVTVAEKLMNHKLMGILAVYDKHPYFQEKAIALQKWSDCLKGIVYPERKQSNIIELPGTKKAM